MQLQVRRKAERVTPYGTIKALLVSLNGLKVGKQIRCWVLAQEVEAYGINKVCLAATVSKPYNML